MAAKALEMLPAVVSKPVGDMTINELAIAIERLALERVHEGLSAPIPLGDPAWMPRMAMACKVMVTVASVQAQALRSTADAAGWRAFAKSAAEFEKKLYAGEKAKKKS